MASKYNYRLEPRLTSDGAQQHTSHAVSSTARKDIRDEVRARYHNICQNCHVLTDTNDCEVLECVLGKDIKMRLGGNYPTLEHIVPAHAGGKFELDNLTLLCNDCNYNLGRLTRYYNMKYLT